MEYLPAWMFLALTILLMAGFPVTFTLLGTGLCFGLIGFGWSFFNLLPLRIWGIMTNVTLIAVPLFVFMGVMLERSGLAEDGPVLCRVIVYFDRKKAPPPLGTSPYSRQGF